MKMGVEYRPAIEVARLDGRGEVYSWTRVIDAPEGFEYFAPYVVALIKLDEGPLVTARLTDVDSWNVHLGMRVECVIRLIKKDGDKGLLFYGYAFRPILPRTEKTMQEVISEILALR